MREFHCWIIKGWFSFKSKLLLGKFLFTFVIIMIHEMFSTVESSKEKGLENKILKESGLR
jgi:hypothetical protein